MNQTRSSWGHPRMKNVPIHLSYGRNSDSWRMPDAEHRMRYVQMLRSVYECIWTCFCSVSISSRLAESSWYRVQLAGKEYKFVNVAMEVDGDRSTDRYRIAVDPRRQMSLEKVLNGNKDRESLVVVSSAPVAGSTSHLIGSETSTRHEAMQFGIATSTDISQASRLLSRPSLLKSLLGVSG